MSSPTTQQQAEIRTAPIPPEIIEEIETFEHEVERLAAGEMNADLFKPFRLQHGIYGQRQPGVQMVRIKIPFGGLTANQLRQIASVADTYTTAVGHVTTRQDIQLHFALLKDVGTIMRKLAEVGLTTREACANTVRNVTACHLAGVCPGEVFDVTPYAKTVALHLLRNPLNQSLPRKFKIAFSGCAHDCALTPIHDIGLLALKARDGSIGFRMTAGGGLGPAPRIGQVLREFVPMDELIPSIEAVIKVFDTLGNRKNRHKARMKFVIDKLGFAEFKRRWEEAYAAMGYAKPDLPPLALLPHQDDPTQLIMPARGNGNGNGAGGNGPAGEATPFAIWRRTNVTVQRQDGFVAATVKLPMGDMTSGQMYALADIAEQHANGNLRTTINQNVILRWIPEGRIQEVYEALAAVGLAEPGAERTEDIIACPGTDTCGLGITSSKGLARALAELLPPGQIPVDLKGVNVKISGCHNSCAQHHIAAIGLHGVGKRVGDHVAPVYELHLGGQVNGTATIGQMTVKLPAKNVPAALSHLFEVYRRDRREGESFLQFVHRAGKGALKQELIPFSILPSHEEDQSYYYDWEADEEFSTEDLGPGECAGGALEMIDNRLLEADQELYQARLLADKHQFGIAVNKAYRAAVAGVKALLVTEGLDPATDADCFAEYERLFARTGRVAPAYHELAARIGDLGPKETTPAFARGKIGFAREFVDACRVISEELGKSLKGEEKPRADEARAEASGAAPSSEPAPVYDLRGVMCPLNYVKTKLKLEMMDAGERLEVWLDAGDPIKNVPMSLRNDGHKVLLEEPLEPAAAHYKVLVEKVDA